MTAVILLTLDVSVHWLRSPSALSFVWRLPCQKTMPESGESCCGVNVESTRFFSNRGRQRPRSLTTGGLSNSQTQLIGLFCWQDISLQELRHSNSPPSLVSALIQLNSSPYTVCIIFPGIHSLSIIKNIYSDPSVVIPPDPLCSLQRNNLPYWRMDNFDQI